MLLLQKSQALLGKLETALGARRTACTGGAEAEVRASPTASVHTSYPH